MDELTIGQVSERTGLSVHALRYYEREGLLVGSVSRSSGGRRRYSTFDVDWIRLCVRFRECGMPVTEIRHYAELVAAGTGNEEERLQLLRAQEARLKHELSRMTECLTVIRAKADLYAQHVTAGTAGSLWTGETPACLALEAGVQPV
ncbi:MerR family transcriptional regulator [Actinoplanes couchii]|uniref:MerR family transcriptional regulator n=1 Tax=Actinoplanes couchii TaxID=403638 RepID=A0ABQ3XTV5_9ACTN|nr:MerR family transcriptional regulator [Actinoplanes couchii]MDR6317760.1 DNA-binding transcriptional MerR regulator [Actinoplanes couchii]GID61928.1 MerR family transcriptional regulator [Actinoplanes couchii]